MEKHRRPPSAINLLEMRSKLRCGDLLPVYIITTGSNEKSRENVEFLISNLMGIVVSRFREDALSILNVDIIDENEKNLAAAIQIAKTSPMMGGRRLTVFKAVSNIKEEEIKRLIYYIENPSKTTTFILDAHRIKLPESILKLASLNGFLIEIEEIKQRSLPAWIKGIFKHEKVNITDDAVEAIVELVGNNLQAIEDAKNKLILFTEGRSTVEVKDVAELLSPMKNSDIYELVDAVLSKHPALIADILRNLENQKTDPIFIEGILTQQIRNLIKVKSVASKVGENISAISSKTGIKDFLVKKYLSACRKFSMLKLEEALILCAKADAELKSSRVNPYRILEKICFTIIM